jgi:hypothetical protein
LELQIYASFNFILEETIVGSLWLQKLHKHEYLKLASATLLTLCDIFGVKASYGRAKKIHKTASVNKKKFPILESLFFLKPWRTAKEKGKTNMLKINHRQST